MLPGRRPAVRTGSDRPFGRLPTAGRFRYHDAMETRSLLPVLAAALLATPLTAAQSAELPLEQIRLPDGFEISVYAQGVTGARSMTRSPAGIIYVGTRGRGTSQRRRGHPGFVWAVADRDGDGRAEEVTRLATGLTMPNGVAYRDGDLYVAEVSRIWKWVDIDNHLSAPPEPIMLNDGLPDKLHHGWKYLAFGPDGRLYFQVGAPCNICESPEDERFGSILRMNPDGSSTEVFARGVRNTVGFDWDPRTDELWFTDNGRDMLGDEIPPDELNHAPRSGMHFGYPYCHGSDVADPEYGAKRPCDSLTPPAIDLAPHVAAVGMKFYTGEQFPERYRNRIFIAEHGSWNRSRKIGYRVSLVEVVDNKAVSYETFAEGWLQGERAWGRPADILEMPDGSLLVSDDAAHVLYRIRYTGPAR